MINYFIAFTDEARALIELEPFGYALNVTDPEEAGGGEVVYAWNQANAMLGGASVILSYKQQTQPGPGGGDPITVNVPTVAPGFWASLLAPERDEALWEQMSANYPAIEIAADGTRTANLDFDFATIKGISPVWAGMPDMGWPYA